MKNYQKKHEIYELRQILKRGNLLFFIQYFSPSKEDWSELRKLSKRYDFKVRFFSNRLLAQTTKNSSFVYLSHLLTGSNVIIWRDDGSLKRGGRDLCSFLLRSDMFLLWGMKSKEEFLDIPKINRLLNENMPHLLEAASSELQKFLFLFPSVLQAVRQRSIKTVVLYLEEKFKE